MLPEIDHDQSDSKTYLKISAKVAIKWVDEHNKAESKFIFVANEKSFDIDTNPQSSNNEARRRLTIPVYNNLQGIGSKIKRFIHSHA